MTAAGISVERDRYEAVLREIADERCGIPGHSVAVGCRSSWLAIMALDPDCHEECSKCSGTKQQERPEFYRMWTEDGEGEKVYFEGDKWMTCDWCRGSGRQLKGHVYGESPK